MERGSAPGRPNPPASWAGLVQPRCEDGLQQRTCIPAAQRFDAELREAGQSTARVARPEGERDPLRQQAARHERERSGRCAVEPLRVVDHTQQRLRLGRFGEETENREPDEKRARRRPAAESEGDAERVPLRIREPLEELEDRRAELLQRRVVELHISFDARGPNDAKTVARLDRVVEQRGLADAGVSVHDKYGAVAAPGGIQQPLEHRALTLPAQQTP